MTKLITEEEKRATRALAPYRPRLQGKRVLLYTGGVKSWSMVSALSELSMTIVGTSVRKSTEEDKERIRDLLGEEAMIAGKIPAKEMRRRRAQQLLCLVHLDDYGQRRPGELSGGQHQRVAVAQTLARDPKVLLLDEPFSAVDRETRGALYRELEDLRRSLTLPILLVTHDFDEITRLADHVVVLEAGHAVAQGLLGDLTARTDIALLTDYFDPCNIFDATVGSHLSDRGLTQLSFAGGNLLVPLLGLPEGDRLRIRIYAREVILALERPAGISVHNALSGRVARINLDHRKAAAMVRIALAHTTLLARVTQHAVVALGLWEDSPVLALIKSVGIDVPGLRIVNLE